MTIYNRPYDELQNDFKRIYEFLIDDYADRKEQYTWSMDRFGDWNYGLWNEAKLIPSYKRKNLQMWFNNLNDLVGFIISEHCDNYLFVITKRGYEFLYREMVQWVKVNWKDRGQLFVETNEYMVDFMKVLEEEGFRNRNYIHEINRQYDVHQVAQQDNILSEDYKIVDMFTYPDYEGKSLLGSFGWGDGSSLPSELDKMKGEYVRETPCYNPKFDFSVIHKNGTHVSSCAAFIDYKNSAAIIEKVCTHIHYRRLGLAQACIRECFKRLDAEGIKIAYIGGYSDAAKALYGKFGEIKAVKWYQFEQVI